MSSSKRLIGLGITGLVLIIIAAILLAGHKSAVPPATTILSNINNTQTHNTLNGSVALQLTDPPEVPAGTSSLVINYSSLQVHIMGNSNATWISSNASGSVNVLSLLNVSQTIGTIHAPNGTQIDMVRFAVTSAKITVDNITYPVVLPSVFVTAHVTSSNGINGTSSILMSFSPSVVTLLTSNSTVFVMIPSLKAVIMPQGTNQTTLKVGAREGLRPEAHYKFEAVVPNITITNASLRVSGNSTLISITIKDNGNQSVTLKDVYLKGNIVASLNSTVLDNNAFSVENEFKDSLRNISGCSNGITSTTNITANSKATDNYGNNGYNYDVGVNSTLGVGIGSGDGHNEYGSNSTNANINISTTQGGDNVIGRYGIRINNTDLGDFGNRLQSYYNIHINGSACTALGFSEFQNEIRSRVANISAHVSMIHIDSREMPFLIAANGTITLPYNIEAFNGIGYVLQPGQSHTFNFSGALIANGNSFTITPIVNSSYRLAIGGEGAQASINITAS